jgi:hypothetical protein
VCKRIMLLIALIATLVGVSAAPASAGATTFRGDFPTALINPCDGTLVSFNGTITLIAEQVANQSGGALSVNKTIITASGTDESGNRYRLAFVIANTDSHNFTTTTQLTSATSFLVISAGGTRNFRVHETLKFVLDFRTFTFTTFIDNVTTECLGAATS